MTQYTLSFSLKKGNRTAAVRSSAAGLQSLVIGTNIIALNDKAENTASEWPCGISLAEVVEEPACLGASDELKGSSWSDCAVTTDIEMISANTADGI
jgi:hypothetical protein